MYKIISTFDGNDVIELESREKEKALLEALTILGWGFVIEKDDENDEE